MPTTRWYARRSIVLPTAVAVMLAPVAAGCSDDEEPKPAAQPRTKTASPSASPTPSPTATKRVRPPHLPLTGQQVRGGVPKRRVLVFKVDNTSAAVPQQGLRRADLIVEELVEGGRTRLAVLVQSKQPGVVGPVRSMRTSDIGIVKPARGVLVASGAAGVVIRKLRRYGVPMMTEGSGGMVRSGSRPAPYNVMARPASILSRLKHKQTKSRDYLPWAEPGAALPAGKPATRATARFSPYQATSWRYSSGAGWRRQNERAAAGDRFTATNLLVLRVRTRDAGYTDPAGSYVPETVTTGSGNAILMHGGRRVRMQWKKTSYQAPLRLIRGGKPLRVPPGKTWVEMVPEGGGFSASAR